jgi:hypothetical protein
MMQRTTPREVCGDWDYPNNPRFGRVAGEPYVWIESTEKEQFQREYVDQFVKAYLKKEVQGWIKLRIKSIEKPSRETKAVEKLRKEIRELRAQVKSLKVQRTLVNEQVLSKLWDNEYDEQWNKVQPP